MAKHRMQMAYECRNNLAPTYLPKSADVWSLGIVLLNLLFHRCPWGDPSDDDIDFYAYRINPVAFLLDRFVGIGREVATYLAENVLNCQGPRVSAGQLGQWAQNLVRMMSDPAPTKPRTAKVSDAAKPLTATHPDATFRRMSYVASPDASQRARPRGSLLSQVLSDNPSPAQSPQAFEMKDLPVVMENQLQMNDWQRSDKTLSPTSPLGASRLETVPGSPPEADTLSQVIAAADATSESDAQALANKAKRRKRGARRGRSAARAEASEAREADSRSRPTKDENSTASHFSQQRPGPTQNSSPRSTLAPSKPNASRFAGLKGAFKNGNQDLEMFAQRAREREALMNKATASAPAKMQAAGGGSYSFGTSSAQSNKSTWSTDDDMRSHWNSTAARRERLGRRAGQKKPFSDTSSATSPSSTTFSRTSGMSSEPTSGSETSATSPHRSSPRAIEPEATVKQTPMISLSRIDEQLQPRRERPEPPTQVPAPQKPKAKGGFFKGLFR